MTNRFLIAGLTAGLAFLGGCSSIPREVIPPAEAVAEVRIFTADGTPTDWDTLKLAAYRAEVVVIAEQHGHPLGLSTAAALWREVLLINQRKEIAEHVVSLAGVNKQPTTTLPALALEFFERDQTDALNAYQRGEIDEVEFLKRTGKSSALTADDPWSTGYPPGHRDMVLAAITAQPYHAPVFAANAPRKLVRLARTEGYSAVISGEATMSPPPPTHFSPNTPPPLAVLPRFAYDATPPDNKYWRDFLSFMDTTPEKYAAASPEDRAKVDSMFRAQSVWDATMADTILRALNSSSPYPTHRPVFLVVGQFHADFAAEGGGGTVQALKALRPYVKPIVVSFQDADPAGPFRAEDEGRADFIVYCGPHPAKQ